MRYNTDGIILKKQNFRASDSFFSIYTKESGKVEAIARGVKKSKSKLGGHLDYFSVVDLMIAEGKKFNHIGGAVASQNFHEIKNDLNKINLGFYCLEITNHFTKEGRKDERIFILLNQLFDLLNLNSIEIKKVNYLNAIGVSHFFILKLLDYLGYCPEIFACIECNEPIDVNNDNYFNPISGGVVCKKCFDKEKENKKIINISKDIIEKMKFIISSDLKNVAGTSMSEQGLKELVRIIDMFLLYRLDGEIKSRKFLTVKNNI